MLCTVLLLTCIFTIFDASIASPVIELTDENFDQEVGKQDLLLVEFFAPWCAHCKSLAPEYLKAAEILQSSSPPVVLAKVDCVRGGKEVCSKQKIEGYPTLKIFRKGEVSGDYDGPKDAKGIVAHMERLSRPSSLYISSEEKLLEFLDSTEPSIVGFFKLDSDFIIRDSFVKCSEKLSTKFRFAHTFQTVSDLGQDAVLPENVKGDQVWLYQPLRLRTKLDTPAVLIPESDPEEMQLFIENNFVGLVGIRDSSNYEYFDSHNPQVVVFFELNWEFNNKTIMYWRNRILKLAKEYKSQMYFAISDSMSNREELVNKYGFEQPEKMHVVITNEEDKYVMSQEKGGKMSIDLITQFVKDYLDGKLTRYVKSEPIPEGDDGPVKIVVGHTFGDIVMDTDKDVLIEFYAPWCSHCRSLEPAYNKLAAKLANNGNIVIAKIDATANDFPNDKFKVEGFPTIFWVPANDKDKPVEYKGKRGVKDLYNHVKKQATVPFNQDSKKEL